MNNDQRMINLFLILFLCTFFIFCSTFFGSKALETFITPSSTAHTVPLKKQKNNIVQPKMNSLNNPTKSEVTLNTATIPLVEIPVELQTVLLNHPKVEISAKSSFSFDEFAKKQKIDGLSSDNLSILASVMYEAILPTNFTIDERNIGDNFPKYAKLGFEAKVDLLNQRDLVFTNPNQTSCVLEFQLSENLLQVTLKGEPLPYVYQIVKQNEQKITPKTIVQFSPNLKPGQILVNQMGISGQAVDIFREIYQGSKLVSSELISNDYYRPVQRVEIHALNEPANSQGTTTQTAVLDNSAQDKQTNETANSTGSSQQATSITGN
jgi:hypothetical protein